MMMKKINYEDISAKIDVFLSTKTGREKVYWTGKLLKQEQIEHFGIYFGKGKFRIDGEKKFVVCDKSGEICGIYCNDKTTLGKQFL